MRRQRPHDVPQTPARALKQRRNQHGRQRLADDGRGRRDGQALERRQPIEIAAEVEAQRGGQEQERVERQRARGRQESEARVRNDEARGRGEDRRGDHRRQQAAPVTASAEQLPPGQRADAAPARDAPQRPVETAAVAGDSMRASQGFVGDGSCAFSGGHASRGCGVQTDDGGGERRHDGRSCGAQRDTGCGDAVGQDQVNERLKRQPQHSRIPKR